LPLRTFGISSRNALPCRHNCQSSTATAFPRDAPFSEIHAVHHLANRTEVSEDHELPAGSGITEEGLTA
jgi:hypothetical protein